MHIQLEPSPEISIHIRCHLHDIIVIHHDRLYEIVMRIIVDLSEKPIDDVLYIHPGPPESIRSAGSWHRAEVLGEIMLKICMLWALLIGAGAEDSPSPSAE